MQAFVLLSLIVGGDYGQGIEHVGPKTALQFIKHVLRGQDADDNLMQLLEAALQDRSREDHPDQELPSQCTGDVILAYNATGTDPGLCTVFSVRHTLSKQSIAVILKYLTCK